MMVSGGVLVGVAALAGVAVIVDDAEMMLL